MRGRKPIPTNWKVLNGNPGKRRLSPDQFRPNSEIPTCPRHLKGEAKKEWARVCEELNKHQMIAAVDRGALAMLCTSWGRYVAAEEMIEEANKLSPGSHGLFVKSPNNMAIQSPWLAVSNRAMEIYKGWCAEFGLTPAQRTRVAPQTAQIELFNADAPSSGMAAI